mgnify:FL=1
MKNLKSKKGCLIIIAVILVIIAGVSIFLLTNKKDNDELKEPNKNNDTKASEQVNIVDVNSKSRPYAIMINNISTARPLQSGLQDAYIMYEIIVEGGITRYLALFLDANTDRIGSIRSARHYYLDYALENDAIFVHHGQSPQALEDISTLKIDRIQVNNTTTGWRDKTLNVATEHTLFTSTDKLKNGLKNLRTERKKDLLLKYKKDEVSLENMENSKKADNVSITYSKGTTTSYQYDAENKVYNRFVNNKEHTDYVTKKQYNFKNIITYQVPNKSIEGDNKGRQDINNIGSGQGYFITNGYAVKINWSKECRECQTKYTYTNGEEIEVNDGNTFIQIQPSGENLVIE